MLIPPHKARKDYSDRTPKVSKKVAWVRIRRGSRKSLIGGRDKNGFVRNN